MVWNLLSNSVKFTPKGGRVQVRLERVNSHVEIIVSDTGLGISPIFSRGSSIGSARPTPDRRARPEDWVSACRSSRHLVELHGGSVHVDSAGIDQGRYLPFDCR